MSLLAGILVGFAAGFYISGYMQETRLVNQINDLKAQLAEERLKIQKLTSKTTEQSTPKIQETLKEQELIDRLNISFGPQ